jgi:5-methylcytosine-specific restriction endonuclease McrA
MIDQKVRAVPKPIKQKASNSEKEKVRGKLKQRDGNWCLLCGKPGPGLHLHRIVYGSHGGKYEIDNCVQLCPVHHELVHSSKKTWAPKLTEYTETQSRRVL